MASLVNIGSDYRTDYRLVIQEAIATNIREMLTCHVITERLNLN